jgi:hypothetical protein
MRLLYAAFLRGLAFIGGAITAYGATAMFTSGGYMPPNAIVLIGLGASLLVAATLWISERRLTGLWPALAIIGIPYALTALGSLGQAECAPPFRPVGSDYSCAPVGSHAIAVVAPLLTLLAVIMFVKDIRALAKR